MRKPTITQIVIDEDVVGELTDDGEIVTDDPCLAKLARSLRGRKFHELMAVHLDGKLFGGKAVVLKKGDFGYPVVVANILLDNGYGLREVERDGGKI